MTKTTTPTGQPGTLLTCATPGHWHYGMSAIIRTPNRKTSPNKVCGNIDLAHHPILSKASNIRQSGPWAA